MAIARQSRAANLRDKVALATETDEADDYDEEHEFELNAASWIESADDNLTEIEEIFYDCVEEIVEVEEIGSVSCDKTSPEDILGSSYLYHTQWSEEAKTIATAIEVAKITGLNPTDIRPIISDGETGELMLLDSGSCRCLEPASPGLRANGTPDPSYKLAAANGKPLLCYGEKQRTIHLRFQCKKTGFHMKKNGFSGRNPNFWGQKKTYTS